MVKLKKKNLDFCFAGRRKDIRTREKNLMIFLSILAPVVLAGYFVYHAVFYHMQIQSMNQQIEQITGYLSKEEIKVRGSKTEELMEKVNCLEEFQTNVKTIYTILEQEPEMNHQIIKAILHLQKDKVTIDNVCFYDGKINFRSCVNQYSNAAQFVGRLEEAGLFGEVWYEGFEYKKEFDEQTGELFYFQVTCVLKRK